MARFNCLPTLLIGKKKRSKELPKAADVQKGNANIILLAKKDDLVSPLIKEVKKETTSEASLTFGNQEKGSPPNVNTHIVGEDTYIRTGVPPETAYEGGDEHDENVSMKRDFSDFDLQALAADNVDVNLNGSVELDPEFNKGMEKNNSDKYEGITPEGMIPNGHVSDPGMGRTTAFWGSPKLKRSCSNIETKRASRAFASPANSHSYGDLQNLSRNAGGNPLSSPQSLKSNCSADRVMLKKRSSSQVLPSRSRRLWWKLFLWSHRNLHRSWTMKPQRISSMNGASHKKEGYTSDTLEPSCSIDRRKEKTMEERGKGKLTDMWPQNQWVAFSAEPSSLDRVDAWVSSLTVSPSGLIDEDDNVDGEQTGDIAYPSSPEIGESSGKNHSHTSRRLLEEVVQANSIIQSLNSFSSVAHISGMGLKVIPAIAAFSSLRSVNLSGNYIVHITPGSLPKSLHTLDLSRNKIATIEGLRDLTRLRVLNLSYNRIARIGHGLSNCTVIKELYLAGNKISDVEGLHRLLKLTVLDLSFNKITTAKALGQLVANYNSLLALNLLGNPIQSNIGDDQLRKAVTGLLPQLAYLNKQPIKPQRAREVATDSIAKAALGNGGWSSRRRSTRRVSQGLGSSVSGQRAVGSGSVAGQKGGRNRSKSRQKH